MAQNIVLPKLGITMTQGTIIKWFKKEGEYIQKGEPLFEIETDKSTQEWECNISGRVAKLLVEEGGTVQVAEPIAIIVEKDELVDGAVASQAAEAAPAEVIAPPEDMEPKRKDRVNATPRAKKYAKQRGLSIADIPGAGERGRVREADVIAFEKALGARTSAGAARLEPGRQAVSKERGGITPYTGVRRIIGERLSESYRSKPHIYVSMEIDMLRATRAREEEKKRCGSATIADYIVAACVKMLREYPMLNAHFTDEGIVSYRDINIGYAVNADRGLIVPVLKSAQNLSAEGMALERITLVDKALAGKLTPDEVSGGTFTISSMAGYGVSAFTSIINPPEVAILSVAAIEKRVIVADDALLVRPMMTVTMAADHRAVDGALVARALRRLKAILEE